MYTTTVGTISCQADTQWVWNNLVPLAWSCILFAVAVGIVVAARCAWDYFHPKKGRTR